MDKAPRIYERRLGRIIGAATSLAGVSLAGVIAALRHRHGLDLSYSLVTALFALSLAAGPIAELAGRRLARRRLEARVQVETAAHPRVPAAIMRRFVAVRAAAELEAHSVSTALANRAVLGVVGWLWVLGLFSASGFEIVGKAFGFVMANGALSIAALGVALFLAGRRLARPNPETSGAKVVGAASLIGASFLMGLANLLQADHQAIAAVAYFGVGGTAVLLPSVWKTAQRLRIERASLAAHPLLPPGADVEDENQRLVETIGWGDGPPEIRAEALRSLLPRLPAAERAIHLDRALETTAAELRLASLELSHKLRHTPALSRLLALVYDLPISDRETRLIPALLHRHRDPEVRPALMHLLGHTSAEVREAAVVSLGLVGDATCVGALREVGRAGGRLREVSSEAIERIQIRLSQSPGQLSLVDAPDAGALSEAETAGALSLPR